MSSTDDIRGMFFEECSDLMEALFEGLATLEEGSFDADTVNAVFRAVHSIKGGAGAFKLEALVSFAHTFETVLDALRAERLELDDKLMQTMLRSADHLAHLVEASQSNSIIDEDRGSTILIELQAYMAVGDDDAAETEFQPMALDFASMFSDVPAEETVSIRFRPYQKLYHNGHDPLLLIDGLRNKGTLVVKIDHDAIAPLDSYAPETPTLTFMMIFTAMGAADLVIENFEFVEGICELIVEPVDIAQDEKHLAQEVVEPEIEFEPSGTMTKPDVIPDQSAAPQPTAKPVARSESNSSTATLRVELDKVDRLINTVGELIINQAMISQRIDQLELPNDSDLQSDMADYKMLARDLQEGVMSIRAQPVKPLFQRMARITREAGDAIGKSVRLVQIGENTEVDKTVIERLADPLTHMIRNAVDHGLEPREKRLASGKPEVGSITLSASHMSGNLMIEVIDDGAGLDRARILDIAIKKNLVPASVELPDAEIDKLLFLPGFSTNSAVSELSGRGVGMDVVKTAVQALGGRISIASMKGKGTTFTIVLPLTLAVVEGIVISVAGETMIVPITAVIETLRPKPTEVSQLGPGQRLLSIRGEYIPIISVREQLGLARSEAEIENIVLVLVENIDGQRYALSVDAIQDQRQVVIKAVSGDYGVIPGVSAATILGNGSIALILDVDDVSSSEPISSHTHFAQRA